MPKINEILIIDVDFSENGDTGVITVGRQTNEKVDIIDVDFSENGDTKVDIIDVDFSENGDTGVITVGRQTNGKVDIINVFRGKDAEELYSKLEGQKKSFT